MTDAASYCKYTKQEPKLCLRNLSFGKAKAFLTWVVTQKTGVGGRRLPGLKSARSLNQYWKEFRLVYERETGKKIDSLFKRKMCGVLHPHPPIAAEPLSDCIGYSETRQQACSHEPATGEPLHDDREPREASQYHHQHNQEDVPDWRTSHLFPTLPPINPAERL